MSNASDKSRWTALIGAATAAVALSTSVVSCQQKQAELVQKNLELDQKKQELEAFKKQKEEEAAERIAAARKNWFDSVVKSDDLVSQVRVLRFLIATETDPKLLEWGKRELEILERSSLARRRAQRGRGHLERRFKARDARSLEEDRARSPHLRSGSHRACWQRRGGREGGPGHVPARKNRPLAARVHQPVRASGAAMRGCVQQGSSLPEGLLCERGRVPQGLPGETLT